MTNTVTRLCHHPLFSFFCGHMRIRTKQSQAGLPRNTLRHLIRGPQRPDRLSLADVMTDRQSDGDIVQEVDHVRVVAAISVAFPYTRSVLLYLSLLYLRW